MQTREKTEASIMSNDEEFVLTTKKTNTFLSREDTGNVTATYNKNNAILENRLVVLEYHTNHLDIYAANEPVL